MTCVVAFVAWLSSWWPLAAAVGVVVAGVLVAVWAVSSCSEERRRGGLLELDTPAGRAAIADPRDDWFEPPVGVSTWEVGTGYELPPPRPVRVTSQPSALQRCNPAQRVHFHGDGDRCECGETANVYSPPGLGFHPFASRHGGDDAA